MGTTTKTNHGHPKIELCSQCGGSGEVKLKDKYERFKRPFGYEECDLCEGSGRVLTKTEIVTTIVAFKKGG